jgi:hypothetical protein
MLVEESVTRAHREPFEVDSSSDYVLGIAGSMTGDVSMASDSGQGSSWGRGMCQSTIHSAVERWRGWLNQVSYISHSSPYHNKLGEVTWMRSRKCQHERGVSLTCRRSCVFADPFWTVSQSTSTKRVG